MGNEKDMRKNINRVSKETGIPVKKVLDFLFLLRNGKPVGNNELLRRIGVSRNALNLTKEFLPSFFRSTSKDTQLKDNAAKKVQFLFGQDYELEEVLWSTLKNMHYRKSIKLLEKYSGQRLYPDRNYDQFTATVETAARRASLLNFFEDVSDKRILFLGDDDFTSVVVANFHTASEITVLDIDDRILDKISSISKTEKLNIISGKYDALNPLPPYYTTKFDIVFTDPPYTINGTKLFVSRAIQSLDPSNQAARIYVCYGNSDRAKERFIPIYEVFTTSGLMVRWVFDKFNRYQGADSIGGSSSLFITEVTPKTKPLVKGGYGKEIYTNN